MSMREFSNIVGLGSLIRLHLAGRISVIIVLIIIVILPSG